MENTKHNLYWDKTTRDLEMGFCTVSAVDISLLQAPVNTAGEKV
jgi:hypothetical protein